MKAIVIVFAVACFSACNNNSEPETSRSEADSTAKGQETLTADVTLPAPYSTKSVRNESKVAGWPEGKMPQAPSGFTVSIYADKLQSPRGIYVAPNGDIFVAQADREGKKGNNIILLRDTNKDGKADSTSVYIDGLKQPFGMLALNGKFYVANTDQLIEFPYDPRASRITTAGKHLLSFPEGRHWTRNIIANASGDKLYLAVGSGSNVAENGMEKEVRRANILQINVDGSGEKIYASGLRNPVGLDWAPGTNTLWTAVNERDELGDDLVPDYLTSVKEGGFYGWPYSYFGHMLIPVLKRKSRNLSWCRELSYPMLLWVPIPHRWAWYFTKGACFRNLIGTAPLYRNTVRGTGRIFPVTKLFSFHLTMANQESHKTSLPGLLETKASPKYTDVRYSWQS